MAKKSKAGKKLIKALKRCNAKLDENIDVCIDYASDTLHCLEVASDRYDACVEKAIADFWKSRGK